MPPTATDYQDMFNYLRSLNFHFLDTWVIDCMNYYKSSNVNITFNELREEVRQQWLLVNLRDVKVPSLPPNLKHYDKITLPGRYAVQVETMVDSSQSCYSQLQELRNVSIVNIEATKTVSEWEVKPNRCLTMTLCDGVQEIRAMEYQPINSLRINDPELLPGFKMILIGPIVCRKGMLMLKQENVKVCGGEVDILTESNCLESILTKKLGLEGVIQKNDSDPLNTNRNNQQPTYSPIHERQEDVIVENVDILLNDNDDLLMNLPFEQNENVNVQQSENSSNLNNLNYNQNNLNQEMYSDECEWEDIDCSNFDFEPVDQNLKSNFPKQSGSSSAFVGSDKTLRNNVNQICTSKFNKSLQSTVNDPSHKYKAKQVQSSISSFFSRNTSEIQLQSNVLKNTERPQYPVIVNNSPFVYLKCIVELRTTEKEVFKIKAIILTLKTKVSIKDDKFALKANISDGSLSLDVDFSSDILENFLGFSPCEMIVMMKEKARNSAIADRIKQAFQTMQNKLISLNCIMDIQFHAKNIPLILSVEEVQLKHLQALKSRGLNKT